MEQEQEKEQEQEQKQEQAPSPIPAKPAATASDEPLFSGDGITSTESRRGRQTGLPLLEELERVCHDIKVDQFSDFKWPEERALTEEVVRQLQQRRILFIESFTESWALHALQRLATVMYTMNEESSLMIRINTGAELDYGFWINERPLPCPVVIIMPANRYDFFQKFTSQDQAQYVLNTLIPELRRLNLHIVCQVHAGGAGQEKLREMNGWMKEAYSIWKVPVVKLELNIRFGTEGPDLYRDIREKIDLHGEYAVGWELISRSYKSADDVRESLEKDIANSATVVKKKKDDLIKLVDNRDFLPKLLVFCASFFNGLHYKDFYELVAKLLQEEQVAFMPTAGETGSTQQLSLRQQWEKDADYFLRECFLVTTRKDGNHRLEFAVPGLTELMSDYISNERYPFFHRVYRNFEQASLMTNLNLSKDLEKSLILLFARAARLDTITYSAEWLKNEVCTLWEQYSKELPVDMESYDELFMYLEEKQFFGELVLRRVPLMISGLLTENNAEYRLIIKEFFRLLLNEPQTRKIAIIIASDLYKKFRGTDTFSVDDLMSYFRRTLEGNNEWEDRFFAYDALRDCLEADGMRTQSDLWRAAETSTSETLIMQFTRLYQLDGILETFQRYFGQYKGVGTYELWDGMADDLFPESFELLVKNLLSENALKNLSLILENRNNRDQLSDRIVLIEGLESAEVLMATARMETENMTAVSLLADITETWFYLLSRSAGVLTPETPVEPSWRAYISLLARCTDLKTLRKIRKCWQLKVGFYMTVIQEMQGRIPKKGKRASYLLVLRHRRACLRMMTLLLQSEPGFSTGNYPPTLKP